MGQSWSSSTLLTLKNLQRFFFVFSIDHRIVISRNAGLFVNFDCLAGEILMIPIVAWLQIVLILALVILCIKPCGIYMCRVLDPNASTFLDPLIKPLEKTTFKLLRITPAKEQTWVEYLFSVLTFSLGSLFLLMLILYLQPYLPFNPLNLPAPSWHLNLNTAISFMTNTNWQSYAGENTMSYFSQMAGLTVQNFISPAVAIAISATLVRALARSQTNLIGNFWTDLIRICYYLLLPLAILFAVAFLAEGIPQNFSPPIHAQTLEGASQLIAQGPVASQEGIKLLGTNGGGFFNANSAHPYENPTPLSNLIQILAVLLIPASQIYYFGLEVRHKKHAWSIFATLILLLLGSAWLCIWSETSATPLLSKLGIIGGNMEGKEQRFGPAFTALFTSVTTDVSCGAVCGTLDSLTPAGGLVPMINMLFSEAIFGGCGSGLYIMLIYVFVTIFFAGLIIGRTPEYLGKKIEAYDIKLTVIVLLCFGFVILGLTAWAMISKLGLESVEGAGPHGFSEILYAYISTTANNGSAFAGLKANNVFYNVTLSMSMLVGRFGILVPVLALSGSLAQKKKAPHTPNDLVVHGVVFTLFLMTILLLFGALTFLPALVMGPILEEFFMFEGILF